MKKWHIAALVIVGLIVAGIAYTMYEKRKVGMVRRVGGGGGSAILQNQQRQKDDPPIIPGPNKTEKETNTIGTQTRDALYGYEGGGAAIYGPIRKTKEDADRRWDDAEFWNYL